MASENIPLQIATLAATYRLLLADGDIARPDLKAKLIAAQGVMEEGTEINACQFEGGSSSAVVMYPKEVVLAAALQILQETDPTSVTANGADPSVVHADLSRTRIEA